MTIEFRRALPADLEDIQRIIAQAQAFMAAQGLEQWQDGYPQRSMLAADIENGEAYLLTVDGRPAATAALLLRDEPDYARIYAGGWAYNGPYAALHRVAMSDACRGSGLAGRLLGQLEQLCIAAGRCAMRIDTHRDNRPMRRFLEKNGFAERGVIYLGETGDERIALEKWLGTEGGT